MTYELEEDMSERHPEIRERLAISGMLLDVIAEVRQEGSDPLFGFGMVNALIGRELNDVEDLMKAEGLNELESMLNP